VIAKNVLEMELPAMEIASASEAASGIRVEIEEPTPAMVSRRGVLAMVVIVLLREAPASFNDGGRRSMIGGG